MVQDTPHGGLVAILTVSSILLVTTLGIAFFTFRPAKPRHLKVSWYLVSLATLCLVGIQVSCVGLAAVGLSGGASRPSGIRDQDVFKPILTVCSGLYSISIIVACRAAFWEITTYFRQHDTSRWILLAFDLLVGLAVLGVSITNIIIQQRFVRGFYLVVADVILSSMSGAAFAFVAQYFIAGCYINAAVGAFFARRWARKYYFGVNLADTMFKFVPAALMIQILLLVPPTIVYQVTDNDGELTLTLFYVSIPWRLQQLIVLGILAWILRTQPLIVDGAERPLQLWGLGMAKLRPPQPVPVAHTR
ncbi:hypothetical protein EXIGLDRAFT_724901 [Exidia glandulosa HHB12029]|uniref:Family A G protein-coupled receptor-like protein n=1 Tax=Exidia glandulosa HHB12029 TaxID=1314781 RepID=A0A165E888_EXIGL|nr:hypothetical protein EXIGLDRAFT_724901 [Exidia glandulosa HHB12029]